MKLIDLWNNHNQDNWHKALDNYWNYVKGDHVDVEKRLNSLDYQIIKRMSVNEFYDFLYDDYFKWKYTAPNRYATTTSSLSKYKNENRLDELKEIQNELFNFDLNMPREGLRIASSIRGLGIAGASGLLALLYPSYFGTVDQFVVKALCDLEELPEIEVLRNMNPECLTQINGVLLINIMKQKAIELNSIFNTNEWTPRTIDMILWTYGR